MANGHSLFPVDDRILAENGAEEYLAEQQVFIPAYLPRGRFPSPNELRQAIQELGFALEESGDWYVTSKDDHTEIWFKTDTQYPNSPTEFWFRRGQPIVLDLTQRLANTCGSLLIFDHSGREPVLLVPDSLFPSAPPVSLQAGFLAVALLRLPVMIEMLANASTDETLLLLGQILQALREASENYSHYEVITVAQRGLAQYTPLLSHTDQRIRGLAFEIIVMFRERFFETRDALAQAVRDESDTANKTRMLYALEKQVTRDVLELEIHQWPDPLVDLFVELSDDSEQPPSVRLAAAHLLTKSQPGLLTPAMRAIFIDALVQPERYNASYPYAGVEPTLKALDRLLLNLRIEILLTALPQINIAPYAHDVLRALLDDVFYGSRPRASMTTLPEGRLAERPPVDEAKMIANLSRDWLYPVSPTKLTAAQILPFQREVLEKVMALDVPWMIHSNILELYGLPATRAAVRDLLSNP